MNATAAFSGILLALLAGAISPGPSFVLVCRTSMLHSRRAGLAAALGMGLGGAAFACLALAGLAALLREVPSLYAALRLAGGAYLLYLAYRIWRGAKEPLVLQTRSPGAAPAPLGKVFSLSLMTQMSNPKTGVVYGSIFTAFLPPEPPTGLLIALVPGVFLVEFCWYAVVAAFFSNRRPRDLYLRSKSVIDRLVAGVLGLLGVRLLTEAVSSLSGH
ncbi:LysE family transporter [Paucibacter sp. APW11]|uniref:LysE family transporter n=1 Tax=Roseateles aquae TaxID=3077235 RepID=A0ABU3PAU5_9BURK|nr:LysE family transporter [Paucibacter sp. APW11]MDT8999699.1 LysE family transporter [Paucibacter sp. APW11]